MNNSSTGHLLPRRALLFFAGPGALLLAGLFIWLAVGELREDTQRFEEYPFSLTPEFPFLGQSDVEALKSAALTYMSLPQWTSINSNWDIVDTDVLTKGGERIGTSASLEFDLLVSLVGPLLWRASGAHSSRSWSTTVITEAGRKQLERSRNISRSSITASAARPGWDSCHPRPMNRDSMLDYQQHERFGVYYLRPTPLPSQGIDTRDRKPHRDRTARSASNCRRAPENGRARDS